MRNLDRAESSCPVVVAEESPNPLASTDTPFARIGVRCDWLDQPIAETLVVPLPVVVVNVGSDRIPEILLTDRNDPAKALRAKAAAPSLRMGTQVWAPRW